MTTTRTKIVIAGSIIGAGIVGFLIWKVIKSKPDPVIIDPEVDNRPVYEGRTVGGIRIVRRGGDPIDPDVPVMSVMDYKNKTGRPALQQR